MKKTIYLLFAMLCCSLFISCNSESVLTDNSLSVDICEVENPYILTKDESIEAANHFFSQLVLSEDKTVSLRSQQFESLSCAVETNDFKVSIANGDEAKRTYQAVPVHTINYKNSKGESAGFAVIIADERFTDKVIAHNDEGNIDLFAGNDAEFWEDLIAGYIFNTINNDNNLQTVNKQSEDLIGLRSSQPNLF